jgi:hypothetical protein
LFDGVANDLISCNALDPFPEPRGTEHREWPAWVKESYGAPDAQPPGLVGRMGEEPYTEPTPRQKRKYHDFDPDDASIRLRSASGREAIAAYMPPDAFTQWADMFMDTLDYPAHYDATTLSLDNVPTQLNMQSPGWVALAEVVQESLQAGADDARYMLRLSERLRRAPDYPDLVLALGLFQGMHRPYLEKLEVALQFANLERRINLTQYRGGLAVLRGPFQQFNGFVLYATLLPLAIDHYEDAVAALPVTDLPGSRRTLMLGAITEAWNSFSNSRLLRTNFDDGTRMICAANQHLRYAKENRIIERLYGQVMDGQQTPLISRLLEYAKHEATVGSFLKTLSFWRSLRASLERQKNARGGRGL